MIKVFKYKFNKKKTNLFLVFLLFSIVTWLLIKLSDTYYGTTTFDIKYEKPPLGLVLLETPVKELHANIRTTGYQFLNFNFKKKDVVIDMSSGQYFDGTFYIEKSDYFSKIQSQLSRSMQLVNIEEDRIPVILDSLVSKSIAVTPKIEIKPAANHIIYSDIGIEPKEVKIQGPKSKITDIDSVVTENKLYENVSEDIIDYLKLTTTNDSEFINIIPEKVGLNVVIEEFSEEEFIVPISVINKPDDIDVKLYPETVKLLCKAAVDDLKDLEPESFRLVVDYNDVINKEEFLFIKILDKPDYLEGINFELHKVSYLIKRQ